MMLSTHPTLLLLLALTEPFVSGSSTWATVQAHLSPGSTLDDFIAARVRKTGTTIVGVVCDDCLVLGADTRATNDRTVADKNCEKIHKIAANIYCCGAGTSADCERLTLEARLRMMEFTRLMQSVHPACAGELCTDDVQRQHCRVAAAHRFLKNATYHDVDKVLAAFVLGGVDTTGPHLYAIDQDGSSSKGPFAALGSGSMAALSVLESEYQDGISEEAAMDLVCLAIAAGIDNDLGSGSNIDLCIIRKNAVEYHRSYQQLQQPQRTARTADTGGGRTDIMIRVRQTRATAAATSLARRNIVYPALQTASVPSQVGDVRVRIDDSIELL
eukprot:TRINITY_DN2092_c0_g1_i6.p1 TRINITY_DN2092_c0_g1~~TRINITY_DN2092_c0_g1_i6.p1  ORF type:complete len:329 (+),score=62.14 TRINITY_DN2092_c0_g1_i6:69-1055(+)